MRSASKGHFFTQMPQPLQMNSLMYALPSSSCLMASRLVLTMGQNLMHGWSHLSGLHLSLSTTATRIVFAPIR
jgi:hypothetical protein